MAPLGVVVVVVVVVVGGTVVVVVVGGWVVVVVLGVVLVVVLVGVEPQATVSELFWTFVFVRAFAHVTLRLLPTLIVNVFELFGAASAVETVKIEAPRTNPANAVMTGLSRRLLTSLPLARPDGGGENLGCRRLGEAAEDDEGSVSGVRSLVWRRRGTRNSCA